MNRYGVMNVSAYAVILFFLRNTDISSEISEEEKSRRGTIDIHESLKVSFADACLL